MSFHVVRWPGGVPSTGAMARVPFDRRALRRVPGARFTRVLGTGAGESTDRGADLARWAVLVVWERAEHLDRFETRHPLARHWHDHADEVWSVRLRPVSAHGTWGGTQPFRVPPPEAGAAAPASGPVAALTRATVRWRRWRAFRRSVPAVDAVLAGQSGRLLSLGIGEWPVGQQATFSLWASDADLRRFAYGDPHHLEVVRRTRDERWYRDELFARFRPVASSGTIDGRNPLAPVIGRAQGHGVGDEP